MRFMKCLQNCIKRGSERYDNVCSDSRPLLNIRLVTENHGLGVVSRLTLGQLPVIPVKLAACCFWNSKFHTAIGGKCTIHTYFKVALQWPSLPSTFYFTNTRHPITSAVPAQSLLPCPPQLVLTIQFHRRD